MSILNCQSVKESLVAHLTESTAVHQVGDSCVATLPIPTIDGRLVDVFVETRMGDYCVVHDGGKAANELILQGFKITDSVTSHFEALASRFKLSYSEEMFQAVGKMEDVQSMILSVGMCSGLAMGQLVGHLAAATEEPLRAQFGRAVRGWARRRFQLKGDVTVRGGYSQHRFDFVAYPRAGARGHTIAMSVLLPGSNSLAAAERFGFKASDLKSTPYAKWQRVAVEGRSELWSADAKALLRKCAAVVIEIPSDSQIDKSLIKENLDIVAAA